MIPDFVRHLTNSEVLIGLSGSLFEVGWTLPQLLVARYIVRSAHKKWWFIGPNIPVRFVILAFAGLILLLGKGRPEAILPAFFICYGIAAVGDGLVGVPWADLSGTSMDVHWRARLFGIQNALTGLIMLGLAPVIALILAGADFPVTTPCSSASPARCSRSPSCRRCSFTSCRAARRSNGSPRWASSCPTSGGCCAAMDRSGPS